MIAAAQAAIPRPRHRAAVTRTHRAARRALMGALSLIRLPHSSASANVNVNVKGSASTARSTRRSAAERSLV